MALVTAGFLATAMNGAIHRLLRAAEIVMSFQLLEHSIN